MRHKQCADKNIRVQNAAQLCALQKGLQHLRRESPSLRFASSLVEDLLKGSLFTASKFAKPQPEKGLHLALLFGRCRVVGLRRLRIKRDGDGWISHGINPNHFTAKPTRLSLLKSHCFNTMQLPSITYNRLSTVGFKGIDEIVTCEGDMLWTLFVILLVLWLLGVVSSYTMGGFIHILLVLAVIALVFQLITGRRAAV
jgi:uncharacterized protein DUF5670